MWIVLITLMLFVGIVSISGCIQDKNENIISKSTDVVVNNKTNNNTSGLKEIRFITVGDPHVKSRNIDTGGNERLVQIVNYVNNLDIDFVVFLGDIADDGKPKTDEIAKNIFNNLTKKYYTVVGNHDIFTSPNLFESYFGPMEHIENVKGYQLLFVGIRNETENGKIKLYWSFDFNKTDKNIPTIVFLHGPTIGPPPECPSCKWGEFFGYADSIQPELDKFSNLVAIYSGHVHYTSDQQVNGVRHITLDGLVKTNAGGISALPSDEIGYSIIKDGKLEYKLIKYN